MNEKIKLMLAFSDPMLRESMAALFAVNNFEITDKASSLGELLEQLKQKRSGIVLSHEELLFTDETNTGSLEMLYPSVKVILLEKSSEIGALFESIRNAKRDSEMSKL